MNRLVQTEEKVKSSSVYIGYLILKAIKSNKDGKVVIFNLIRILKKDLNIIHHRQVIFGLSFLYCLGLIDFSEPYVYII